MLSKRQIEALIPHSGAMSLLDRVDAWDDQSIRCHASSHRDPANPLRSDGTLGSACAVEYAAQAIAVHGGLTGAGGAAPRLGYLATVRSLVCHVPRLDDLSDDLLITADRLAGEDGRVLYQFSVICAGRVVAEGRAAVVLDGMAP
jgi:predicted hotdog family 3-hydroxylacyl-ACP dehydratase